MKLNLLFPPLGLRTLLAAAGSTAFAAGATWLTLDLSSEPAVATRDIDPAPMAAVAPDIATGGVEETGPNRSATEQTHPDETPRTLTPYQQRRAIPSRSGNHSGGNPARVDALPRATTRDARSERAAMSSRDTAFVPIYEDARVQSGPVLLEVTPGIRSPAVLVESDEPLSSPAAEMKERIAQDFADEITPKADPDNGEVPPATFDEARNRADERYRMFFGDAAYNQMTMQAAKKAVNDAKKR